MGHESRHHNPPLIYLPGMDGTGQLFYTQAPALQPFFDLRCFAVAPSARPSWPELAEDVYRHLDPTRPAVLCGESFGACLALQFACQWPHLCQSLVLVNPATSMGRRPWLGWSRHLLPILADPVYRVVAEQGLGWLAELDRLSPPDRIQLQTAVQSVSKATTMHRLSLLEHFGMSALPLERITCPVLLVAGGSDRLLPSSTEVERLAARIGQARIEILPKSGHACLLERDVLLQPLMEKHHLLPEFGLGKSAAGGSVPLRSGVQLDPVRL